MVNRTDITDTFGEQHHSKSNRVKEFSEGYPIPETVVGYDDELGMIQVGAADRQQPLIQAIPQVGKRQNPDTRRLFLRRVLPTVLVPLAVANAVGYKLFQQQSEGQLKQQLQDFSVLSSEATAKVLKQAVQTPETIATNPWIIDATHRSNEQAKLDSPEQPAPEQIGQPQDSQSLQSNPALNDYLKSAATAVGIPELILTDQQGRTIAANKPTVAAQQQNQDWWKKTKTLKQTTQPELDKSTNTLTIGISRAIVDPESSEFLGVIRAVLPATRFNQMSGYLNQTNINRSQQIQLLSPESGRVIATISAQGAAGAQSAIGGSAVEKIAAALVKAMKTSLSPDQVAKIKAQYSLQELSVVPGGQTSGDATLTASFMHQGRQYSVATIPQTDWVAVASVNRSEVTAASSRFLLICTLVSLVLAGAASAIIFYFVRKFTTPLRDLAGVAEQITAGEMDRVVVPQGTQEIQTLAQTLNHLASKVKDFSQEQTIAAEQFRLLTSITNTRTLHELDVNRLFNTALTEARQILAVERIVIYRFKSDWSGYISHESVAPGWIQALNDEIEDACIPESILDAYQTDRVVATNDVFNAGFHPDHVRLMERLQVRANLVVPILHEGQLFGLLIAHHCAAIHPWQEREINFMRQLAAQLGVTLDRMVLVQKREMELARSHLLRDVTQRLTQADTSDAVLAQLPLFQIRELLKVDRVLIYRFDENWQGTITAESVEKGFPHALGAVIYDPCFAEDYVEKYKQGRVQAVSNIYEAGLTPCHLNQLEPFAVKANLVAPILQGEQLLGLLIAHQCSAPRNWEQIEIDLVAQIANQVALALDRCNLLHQKEMAAKQAHRAAAVEAERSQLLRDITLQLTQANTSEAVLAHLPLFQIRQLLKTDRIIVYLFDQNWKGTITAESVVDGFPRALGAQIYDPCFAGDYVEKYKRGRVQATPDIYKANLTTCHLNQLEPFAVRANLVAPILQGEQLLGLLIAHHCSAPRNWEQVEIDLFAQVANQIALALDRCNPPGTTGTVCKTGNAPGRRTAPAKGVASAATG
ncbi:GAF domain-containing protein [Kovacikia minuta CCNUW1]|uniref:GAF domain-containing protein n=1 Tax=Kovacikia minuta TaxID=2931930 RepID=UPI001CCB3EB5|nr:GAF domain-containing protein [Kovacikia minuta]UBF25713.1 GAF domain-containing protein [Kovacikia minuta CCNUW1]